MKPDETGMKSDAIALRQADRRPGPMKPDVVGMKSDAIALKGSPRGRL